MLKRENRLRAKEDFDRVKREGKRWNGDLLSLSVSARAAGPSRFGFVVSKRVAPKAAARNRLKRQMRAVARGILGAVLPSYDCVIVARSSAVTAEYDRLATQIKQLLRQAGLLDQQIETQA